MQWLLTPETIVLGHTAFFLSCTWLRHAVLSGADPTGACYKALGFSPGFEAPLNPYVRLLVMLAGIQSPGTIQEVGCGLAANIQCFCGALHCLRDSWEWVLPAHIHLLKLGARQHGLW